MHGQISLSLDTALHAGLAAATEPGLVGVFVFVVEARYGRIEAFGHALPSHRWKAGTRAYMGARLKRRQSAPSRASTAYVAAVGCGWRDGVAGPTVCATCRACRRVWCARARRAPGRRG